MAETATEISLFERTIRSVRSMWQDIAASLDSDAVDPSLDGKSGDQVLARMQECLDAVGGEASARARAAQLGETYLMLDDTGRRRFLGLLAQSFGPDPAVVDKAIEAYYAAAEGDRDLAIQNLRDALRPPRLRLLTQFNALPQGVKFLVDMRADLLRHVDGSPALQALDKDLHGLLETWFDIGFLELQRITWDSPASLLEKLIAYEAVHEIRSWRDLQNRLDSDRRLFAFFHPRMPTEPLIFVEVALVDGVAGSIQSLLDEDAPKLDPSKANTAIFYSISTTQEGLRGVGFGNFLIKRVVETLADEFPVLKSFATLSPIPGFCKWLRRVAVDEDAKLLTEDDGKRLKKTLGGPVDAARLHRLLSDPEWSRDAETAEVLRPVVLRLCARYLVKEKRGGKPLDPVARFHLSNGAQIERLNWLGDVSDKGIEQSGGVMVNYLYKLDEIERNHERFARDGHVATSSGVRALLKG